MNAIADLYGSDNSLASASADSSSASDSSDEETAATAASVTAHTLIDDGNSAHRKRKRDDVEQPPPQWIRTFAHVDGNWPSHVSIVVGSSSNSTNDNNNALRALCTRVIDRARHQLRDTDTSLVAMDRDRDGLHLSLSRPFALRFEQISPFVDELRTALKWRRRFVLALVDAVVLVNDEHTRSFLALRVADGATDVIAAVKCVDTCMRRFGLPVYYEDPIAHVSIASCLGDALPTKLSSDRVAMLLADEVPWRTAVTAVHVAIGNRQFQIALQ